VDVGSVCGAPVILATSYKSEFEASSAHQQGRRPPGDVVMPSENDARVTVWTWAVWGACHLIPTTV
jgi:hypothetical protein